MVSSAAHCSCSSSSSSPPDLAVDSQGKLEITGSQAQLAELLLQQQQQQQQQQLESEIEIGDASQVRQQVRNLLISYVDRIAEEWPALPRLQDLRIKVRSESLTSFPRVLRADALPSLQCLALHGKSAFFDQGSRPDCPILEGDFAQLKSITISCLALRCEAIVALLRCPLDTLHLSQSGLGSAGSACLAQALRERGDCSPGLTRLHLRRNLMGSEGCHHLAQALQQSACPNLTHLDLYWNNMGNEGCAHLAQALQQRACPRLTHLYLKYNKFDAEGCKCLAQALEQRACPDLVALDLCNNAIGAEGCTALARGLAGCPGIQELRLHDIKIVALPDGLGELRCLRLLDISYNGVRKVQPALYDWLLQLDQFHARGNPFESPPLEVCCQGLNALKDSLRQQRSLGLEELRTVRVMMVGDTMHGKTTLCRSLLRGGAPGPKAESEERRHALDIHDWVINKPKRPLTIKLWDFAGHDVYYAAHRTFFSRFCIYVLVARIEVDGDKMQGVIGTSIDWLMSICKAVPSGAQIMVVGTFPHDQRAQHEQILQDNLAQLEEGLIKADRERVRMRNERLREGSEDHGEDAAREAEICGVFWADCHSDENNVECIAAELKQLAESVASEQQLFHPSLMTTLEAHRMMCASTSAGVTTFQAFRDRVDGVDDYTISKALQFANDVGILQYYPHIDKNIVFIDPLFLVEAFGVLIYDKDAFCRYITGKGFSFSFFIY